MSVAVVVPWRGGCKYRERAWRWIHDRYRDAHPDWQLILSPGPDPWVKAKAVMPAIEATSHEFILVADADVWCEGLQDAHEALLRGAQWAVPHEEVRRLTDEGTEAYMAGAPWQNLPLDRDPYIGLRGGGLVMARRETFLSVPMDPRFVGWGAEDMSWALALHCLLGPCWRGKALLLHFWHPLQPRDHYRTGSRSSHDLHQRYHAARRNPDKMAQLLEEIHVYRNERMLGLPSGSAAR